MWCSYKKFVNKHFCRLLRSLCYFIHRGWFEKSKLASVADCPKVITRRRESFFDHGTLKHIGCINYCYSLKNKSPHMKRI